MLCRWVQKSVCNTGWDEINRRVEDFDTKTVILNLLARWDRGEQSLFCSHSSPQLELHSEQDDEPEQADI